MKLFGIFAWLGVLAACSWGPLASKAFAQYQTGCCRVLLLPYFNTNNEADTVSNGVTRGGRASARAMDAKCIDIFKRTGMCNHNPPDYRCTKLGAMDKKCEELKNQEKKPTPTPTPTSTPLPTPKGCCGIDSSIVRDPGAAQIFENACKGKPYSACGKECEWYTDTSKCVAPPKGCCGLRQAFKKDPGRLRDWRVCSGKYYGNACENDSNCQWYTDLTQCNAPEPTSGCCNIRKDLWNSRPNTGLYQLCRSKKFVDCVTECAWFMDLKDCKNPLQ